MRQRSRIMRRNMGFAWTDVDPCLLSLLPRQGNHFADNGFGGGTGRGKPQAAGAAVPPKLVLLIQHWITLIIVFSVVASGDRNYIRGKATTEKQGPKRKDIY
jgi:hypothetical protein